MKKYEQIIWAVACVFICYFIFGLWKPGCEVKFKDAEAQEKVKKVVIQSKYLKFEPDEVVLYEISVSNDTLTINRAIAAICVLDLLKEYSSICYDSSFIKIPSFDHPGDSAWVHFPMQPTLPGFMKFLERKHEVKK